MPASPIVKEVTPPDNWVQLQKMMTPDRTTACYWSVWYDIDDEAGSTAWLMWCPYGEDPTVNDNWSHAEEIDEECRNVLNVIKSVYGVSFHESIWVELDSDTARATVYQKHFQHKLNKELSSK